MLNKTSVCCVEAVRLGKDREGMAPGLALSNSLPALLYQLSHLTAAAASDFWEQPWQCCQLRLSKIDGFLVHELQFQGQEPGRAGSQEPHPGADQGLPTVSSRDSPSSTGFSLKGQASSTRIGCHVVISPSLEAGAVCGTAAEDLIPMDLGVILSCMEHVPKVGNQTSTQNQKTLGSEPSNRYFIKSSRWSEAEVCEHSPHKPDS